MIGNKSDIEKALVFADDKTEYYLEELPLTAEQRTKAQNNTFYRCFKIIGDKLGYSKEFTKQCLLKGVFGIETIKMGGMQFEVAIIGSTTQLTKEQAILLIERIIEFGKRLKLGEIVQSRELNNLFYNN